MDNVKSTIQPDRLNELESRSSIPVSSASLRKPSPETIPHPRQANFARPLDRQNSYPEPRHTPTVGEGTSNTPNPDTYHGKSPVGNSSYQSGSQSALFAPKKTTLERPTRPSQLKLAPFLPPVNEVPGQTGSEHHVLGGAVSGSSLSASPDTTARNTSYSRNGKPLFKKIRRNDSVRSNQPIRESETLPASDREETIKALSAAIAAGCTSPTTPTWPTTSKAEDVSEVRMPFPDSPSSVYTHESFRFPQAIGDAHDSKEAADERKENSNHEMLNPQSSSPLPGRSVSSTSTNPLLGLGINQNITNIPTEHVPPNADRNAGGEADTRQSITSLPDLIRRATRLASNLDRGKTASRLGLEDMLGYSHKKAGKHSRESTYSDVLVSFPAPGVGTPPLSRQRQHGEWSGDEKAPDQSTSRRRRRKNKNLPERRCCGMSLKIFLIVMIIVVILIAAAVLVPIFLVLVPKENQSSTSLLHCTTDYPCRNGGISLVDNSACSCICVDGFTGNQCETAADPDCITADLREGSVTYNNASVGSDVLTVLSKSQSLFSIPLNTSVLLSVFATNNISCSGENSLVRFNAVRARGMRKREKRFFMLPGLEPEAAVISIPTPTHDPTNPKRTAILAPRDSDVASTSGGIVSQTATSSTLSTDTTATSTTASSATSTSIAITTQQTAFAEVVVLYVLAQSRTPSIAVNAQQLMERYFLEGGPSSGNTTVEIVSGAADKMTADFAHFTILLGNGTTVGE